MVLFRRARQGFNRWMKTRRYMKRGRQLLLQGCFEEAASSFARSCEGWFSHNEMRLLYRTVLSTPGPGRIAEIGSWKGRSTAIMAFALRQRVRDDAHIIAIDPHEGSAEHRETIARTGSTLATFQRNMRRLGLSDLVETILLPSHRASTVLRQRRETLRLLLIDGAHDEASVRRDITHFLPLLRKDSVVALHDCKEQNGDWPGVWQAFQKELAPHVTITDHVDSLLITRVKALPKENLVTASPKTSHREGL